MPWYHGNLHCHSTNSDGKSSPAEVAKYYSNCTHFELCNAGPDCNSLPLPGKSYADDIRDALLSNNIRIIGLASVRYRMDLCHIEWLTSGS